MSIDDARRLALYDTAREHWGAEAASTLFEMLPASTADLATKEDLRVLAGELRVEFAEFRGEIRNEIAEFRGDVRSDMATLRVEFAEQMRELTTRLLVFTIPTMLSGIGLAFAAAKIA